MIGAAQILAILVALPVGVLAGTRPYSVFDQVANTLAFVGFSLPTFFTGLLLILLVVLFAGVVAFVISRTDKAQGEVERYHTMLAGNAQDALSNIVVVQSFTRLGAETRLFGDIARQVIEHQFPVLNWWAVVNVLTRAASTIAAGSQTNGG